MELDKSLQCSAWAAPRLSNGQLRYAALDAWAPLALLALLHEQHEQSSLSHTLPAGSSSDASEGGAPAAARSLAAFAAGFVDPALVRAAAQQARFATGSSAMASASAAFASMYSNGGTASILMTQRGISSAAGGESAAAVLEIVSVEVDASALQASAAGAGSLDDNAGGSGAGSSGSGSFTADSSAPSGGGSRRLPKPPKAAARKTALYDNCKLLAPDGSVLCTCSSKKVRSERLAQLCPVKCISVAVHWIS